MSLSVEWEEGWWIGVGELAVVAEEAVDALDLDVYFEFEGLALSERFG